MLNLNLQEFSSRLFGEADPDTLNQLLEKGEFIKLQTGDYLFNEGEKDHEMYIVLKGRLRALKTENKKIRILGDIGSCEVVGEIAFFTAEPRMASIIAIRKSTVLKISQKIYQELIVQNPNISSVISKLIINRLKRNEFQKNKNIPPKNIAIFNLHAEHTLDEFITKIKSYFSDKKENIFIINQPQKGILETETDFDLFEERSGINILLCDNSNMDWSRQCLIYADLIIVASPFNQKTELTFAEKELQIYSHDLLHKKTYLLLFHPNNSQTPVGTQKWLKHRPIDMQLHIRPHLQKDINRFCRIISHTALGLVLGGGGAKGFAHIGVVQALYEKGVEIDFLGGTSSGALYGIGMSFIDFEFDKIHQVNESGVKRKLTSRDFALPLVSMMTFRKFKKYLLEIYSNHHLEDIWVNSYCVSTNFTQAKIHIHRSGILWKQISASMAIPGVFPPVVIDKNLHVDGGVMDNMPIDSMFHYPVDRIIAVSLSGISGREVDYYETPSSWQIVWDKIKRTKKYRIPSLSSIVVNSLTINSTQRQKLQKSKATHYLELKLKGVGLLDDSKWKEIMDQGFKQAETFFRDKSI